AAAILRRRHPDLRISVVGDGWWSQRLQQVAQTLGVSDLVDFLGFVDEKTKHRVYASAWVLALPSLKEGWGIVVMEAATHGVPAVAYREAGGVAESIVHEQTGMLVDGDLEDFAQALDAVLSNPAHRDRLGESARIRSEEFTWAATTASFADVLGEVAAKGGVSVVPAPSGHVEHHGGRNRGVDQLSP
ncbi:MAG TPA: glycosyltransferase, partial [Actinomycetota bacterium]|nr:glycosyltransferase [Actinomycetota bacterium]